MNGKKCNPEKTETLDDQYSPSTQKPYDKDDLKHGKSDEEIEHDIDAENEKIEEKEEEEANA